MKKKLAIVLTATLLAFPVSAGVVLAETTTPVTVSEGTPTDVVTPPTDTVTPPADTVIPPVVNPDGGTVDAGTLPDSPLAWFENLIEKIQVALTFNPEKKAKLITEQANEDLAEAAALDVKGDEENVEKTLTSYSEKIVKAQEFLALVEDKDSEESQQLQVALTKVNANNVVVLGGLLEKLPPQAAQKVALNIVRAMEKALVKAAKLEEKQGQVDQDEDSPSGVESDSTTDTEVAGTVDSDLDQTDADAIKDESKMLSKEAKKALDEFRVAIGVKKLPQGNAYGYYKNDKENENAKQTQNASVSQATEPVVEQVKETKLEKTQPVQKAEVKTSSPKQESDRGDDHGKKDK